MEPELPIVDAHHHLYGTQHDAQFYRAQDLAEDLATGHRVMGTVWVEAYESGWRTSGPEELRSLGEVERIVRSTATATASGTRHGNCQVAAGMVSNVDLTLGERVAGVLDAHAMAAQGRLRGVRYHATYDDGVVGAFLKNPKRHLLADQEFRRGFACLRRFGLAFDALIFHTQLGELADLASAFPETRVVLNHVGVPIGVAEYRSQRASVFADWQRGIRALAVHPNASVKLGGMGMPIFGLGFEAGPWPASSETLANAWQPFIEVCIDAFGPGRCMFESNFPVDMQSAGYAEVWNAFKLASRALSQDERRDLFYRTACRTLPASRTRNRLRPRVVRRQRRHTMTHFTRRALSKALLLACASMAAPWARVQESFPSKPIRIVVPTTPGGNLDAVARVIAERLTASFGQPVIVENRTGASSSIGTRFVGQSPPDGHTILMMGNTFASTPAIMPGAGYDPVKEFVGVSLIARLPELLVVPANSPYQTLADLIAAAKAKPGQITYASAGAGSIARFAAERLAHQLGLKLVHVPYKGNGDALIDMVAGRVAMMFDQMSTSLPHVKGGRLRALAITSSTRSDVLPDVPTFADAGIKEFEDYTWIGFVAPAAVPRETIGRLNAAVLKVLQQPDVRSRFTGQGLEVRGAESPDEFTAFIRSEVTRLTKLAEDANIKLE